MLASISPFGERAKGQRWTVTVAWYTAASVAGGTLLGTASGGLGNALPIPAGRGAMAVAVILCALSLGLDVAGRRPIGPRRQVDDRWLDRYRGWVYGAGFGIQLGVGVATIVASWSFWLGVALAMLTGSVAGGAVIGAAFGAARAVPILALARVQTPDDLRRLHVRHQASQAPVARWDNLVQVVAAVTLLGAIL